MDVGSDRARKTERAAGLEDGAAMLYDRKVTRGQCPWLAGGAAGYRHMRAQSAQDAGLGGAGDSQQRHGMVTGLPGRQPGRHVYRLHAAQPRRCRHLAGSSKERTHKTVSEGAPDDAPLPLSPSNFGLLLTRVLCAHLSSIDVQLGGLAFPCQS